MLLGGVADDFTGATDLAGVLVGAGARTVVVIGGPARDAAAPDDTDAVVVALPIRTVAAETAVTQAADAAHWLLDEGARRLFSKYCSTFDSTDTGNIGPVADALCDLAGAPFTIACPAYPANGRTVRDGWLYVNGVPLHETGMRHHPLTPMTDPDLVAVLGRQTRHPVGLIDLDTVRTGAAAVATHMAELAAAGVRYGVTDAETDADLATIAAATRDLVVVTGGAAIAGPWIRSAFGARLHRSDEGGVTVTRDGAARPGVILAGSCSEATRRQVDEFALRHPTLTLDPEALADGFDPVPVVKALADAHAGPILVASSAPPDRLAATQASLGRERAAAAVETALARCAVALHADGVRRFVVAGGETSGAVVRALGVRSLRVGADLDPGVPRTVSLGPDPVELVLKSGNFGAVDLFERALE